MNKVLPLLLSFVLIVAISWRVGHHRPARVAEKPQIFSALSRKVASAAPTAVVAPPQMTQNEKKPGTKLVPNFSRVMLDPAHAFFPQDHAQKKARAEDAERIAHELKSLPRADLPKVLNDRYRILGARALSVDQYRASMGSPIVEQNGYRIVGLESMGVDSAKDTSWKDLAMTSEGQPVLVNSSNGRIAIVTGTLEIKLNSLNSVNVIAEREHLSVLSVDASTNTAYFRAPEGYALFSGMRRLAAQSEVARVELELYQSRKRTN